MLDRRQQILIKLLLSLIFFITILYFVGIDAIINIIANAKVEWLIAAVAIYITLNFSMSYRIKIVLESIGDKLTPLQILPSNFGGMFASDFTPARAGYFFTAFSLSSKYKIPTEKTIVAIFGPQLFDFLIKATSAAILTYLIVNAVDFDGFLFNALLIIAVFAAVIFVTMMDCC